MTPTLKLSSKSKLAAWADFTGHGKCDTASWDGKTLALSGESVDGTFPEQGVPMTADLHGQCLGLRRWTADARTCGMLAGTAEGRCCWCRIRTARLRRPCSMPAEWTARSRPAGACLVTGPRLATGWRMCWSRSPIRACSTRAWRGPVRPRRPLRVAQGKGRAVAWLGDFDCDGRMDIFISGEEDAGYGTTAAGSSSKSRWPSPAKWPTWPSRERCVGRRATSTTTAGPT